MPNPLITIYGIRLDGLILYIGSCWDLLERKAAHRRTGKPEIREAILNGAEFVVLETCQPEIAYERERNCILHHKMLGQCTLNYNVPRTIRRTNGQSRYYTPIRLPNGATFPSLAAAARSLGISGGTMANYLKYGYPPGFRTVE
jgi:hypothetical protein